MSKVYCFGNTQNGELGLGGIEEEHILAPRKQRLPYDRRKYHLIQLASGSHHTLLLLKSIQFDHNVVFSCGLNESLQLGRGGSWKRLEQVDGLNYHNIINISCGYNNNLVLSDAGQLFSWGCNRFGQLGLGTKEDSEIGRPSLIKKLATKFIIQISCGGNHCLTLTKSGEVYSWGSNSYGQLGLGISALSLSTPTLITSLQWTPVRQIAAGGLHSAILSYTGAIYLFGKNEFGQLGLSDTKNRSVPTLQKSLRNQKIAYISLGSEHSAALTFEGGLFTWGNGTYGQLGHGSNSNDIAPRKVFELMGVRLTQVSCGRCHTLVVSEIGRVYSFGLNGSGQLGIGSTNTKLLPTTIRGPWTEISTQEMILRNDDRSLQIVNNDSNRTDFDIDVNSNEHSEFARSDSRSDSSGMEINEIHDLYEDTNLNENQLCFVEEPDEEKSTNETHFICSDNTIYEKMDTIEINEYESDPDSESDEPIRTQYIVNEIICSKGDQSFIIIQPLDKFSLKDLRKNNDSNSILKLQNEIFEQFSTISKEAIPMDTMDYIETVFSSFPAINSSYLGSIHNEEYDNIENKVKKFKINEKINFDESTNFFDGMINWSQAFHGFNVIEDAQNERINELIYQIISKILQNMPDIIIEINKDHSNILDEEVMRIYQLLPLYHMFRMTNYCDKSQALINLYANAILKLSSKGVNCLKIWWCRMNQRYFKNLIEIFKRSIKINLYEQHHNNQLFENANMQAGTSTGRNSATSPVINQKLHTNLYISLEVLKLLYSVNKFMEKIAYKEFYIDGISEMFDLKQDYYLWKNNRYRVTTSNEYFLCNYPFIFDSPAKNVILCTDSELQQESAAEFSIRKQILMSIPVQGEITVDPYLTLSVKRDNILQDTIHQLCLLNNFEDTDFKKPLRVYFENEEAVDAGQGMKKEFFLLLMKEILDQKYGMFVEYPETNTIWFNHVMNDDDDVMYRLIGILCGLAIYNKVIIDLPFPLTLYKKILNETLELENLADLDPMLMNNLNEMLQTRYKKEEFDAIFGDLTFTITTDTFGSPVEYELFPNGKNKRLTYENRQEYVYLYWRYLLVDSVEKQFRSFYNGFMKVLDRDILQIFQAEELMQLVEGEDLIDWEELERSTNYKPPFHKKHETIRTFWKVFYSFTEQEKKKFLKFLTGSDRIPITGVRSLNVLIQPMNVSDDHLPVAHTCFNILDLPLTYSSSNRETKMRHKILQASELAVEFALV